MTGFCHRAAPPAALALGALIAACQPLPHPFADDRPPAALLDIRGSAGVAIQPIEGEPDAVAAKLGAATAGALLKREIPASDTTTSLGSYLLYGRVVASRPRDGKSQMTALWRLYDAKGKTIGERSAKADAPAGEWASAGDAAVARLAAASAEALAPLLADETPSPAAPPPKEDGRVRLALGKISGAPGDGAAALAAAVATVLKRQQLSIVEDGANADLQLDAAVAVAPATRDRQHVKIVWRVRRADGAEIGTVGQENEIPRGRLDGAWGDIAYNIAIAAGDGLVQLVERGAPERSGLAAAR
jgi:hypothetical protein